MKLFTRYNRINLLVMAVVFVLSGIGYYLLINAVLIHELDEALDAYRNKINQQIIRNHTMPSLNEVVDDVVISYHVTASRRPARYANKKMYDPEDGKKNDFRQLEYTQYAGGRYYEISIAKPIEGTHLLAKTIAAATLLLLLLIIVISILLNHFVLRRLWQAFYDMLAILKKFRLGQKEEISFPQTDIDEFRLLGSNLQQMFYTVRKDFETLKEFTENASHELQTPLAIIRSKLDILVQEDGLSDIQADALKSVYEGIKRLTKLNQSLLLLVKMENHHFTDTEPIDLKEKLTEKLEQFQEIWTGNQIQVAYHLDVAAIHANAAMTDILLNNLLSNAGMHNHPGGLIDIRLQQGMLTISNTGSGVSLDRERLFRRFYKVQQHSRHNGLGLSIVKQICEQSHISISYGFNGAQHSFTLTWNQPS